MQITLIELALGILALCSLILTVVGVRIQMSSILSRSRFDDQM